MWLNVSAVPQDADYDAMDWPTRSIYQHQVAPQTLQELTDAFAFWK